MVQTHEAKYVFLDGKKAVVLSDLDNFLDYLIDKESGEVDTESAWNSVPWAYRGIKLRAQAVAAMPFNIYRGETIVDEYGGQGIYENKNGILPNPARLFGLIEAAVTAVGRSYLAHQRNRVKTTGLRYLSPTSIEPKITETQGLVGWERNLNGRKVAMELEDIVYFWDTDWAVEYGPPRSSPLLAALKAAGVLIHVDTFVENFAKRGMVKATLLSVPKGTAPEEKTRLKEFWSKLTGGVDKSWGTHILEADTITPTIIGEGLKELENIELTDEKRKDISTALGVPSTMLFSGDASGLGGAGVVQQDDLRFYRDTVVPSCKFAASVLNEQVLNPMGLNLVHRPETLDVFQADENLRSQAFRNYVGSGFEPGIAPSIAAQMLGLELPEGIEYSQLDEGVEDREVIAPADARTAEDRAEAVRSDLRKWERASLRRLSEGKGASYNFESDVIPLEMRMGILAMLRDATTREEVRAAFAAPFRQGAWAHYP